MQYILTEQEYKDAQSKGNLLDHKLLMRVLELVSKVNSQDTSSKRLNLLSQVTEELEYFHQNGDVAHIIYCENLF